MSNENNTAMQVSYSFIKSEINRFEKFLKLHGINHEENEIYTDTDGKELTFDEVHDMFPKVG